MRLATWITATLSCWLILALPAAAQSSPHPLVGKIFDTRTSALSDLSDPALLSKLFPCGGITLLGEVHDNTDHHQMRATLIRGATTQRSTCAPPAFVFEHISADQQAGLDAFIELRKSARRPATASDFFRLLEWDKSGWPSSKSYTPLVRDVVRSKAPILAGDPGRVQTRRVAKEGIGAIEPDQLSRLGLDMPLAPASNDALLTELEASHCGLMPKSAFGRMAAAQRYRDAYMADIALKAAEAHGSAVIFAGNGHVRTDRGVPYYVTQRAPKTKVIAVVFTETADGKTDPAVYGPRDPTGNPAANYVAFADPYKRDDPCEAMRAQFKSKPKQP